MNHSLFKYHNNHPRGAIPTNILAHFPSSLFPLCWSFLRTPTFSFVPHFLHSPHPPTPATSCTWPHDVKNHLQTAFGGNALIRSLTRSPGEMRRGECFRGSGALSQTAFLEPCQVCGPHERLLGQSPPPPLLTAGLVPRTD